jgi:hypothetical protein
MTQHSQSNNNDTMALPSFSLTREADVYNNNTNMSSSSTANHLLHVSTSSTVNTTTVLPSAIDVSLSTDHTVKRNCLSFVPQNVSDIELWRSVGFGKYDEIQTHQFSMLHSAVSVIWYDDITKIFQQPKHNAQRTGGGHKLLTNVFNKIMSDLTQEV